MSIFQSTSMRLICTSSCLTSSSASGLVVALLQMITGLKNPKVMVFSPAIASYRYTRRLILYCFFRFSRKALHSGVIAMSAYLAAIRASRTYSIIQTASKIPIAKIHKMAATICTPA